MVEVSKGGQDVAENLIALCPTCHAMYHRGFIPQEAIRQWKARIVSIFLGQPVRTRKDLPILPPDFDWGPSWFSMDDSGIEVHGKRFSFEDIIQFDERYFDVDLYGGKPALLRSRVILSPDRRKVAILVGDFFTAMFYGQTSEALHGKRVLHVYTQDQDTPIFISDPEHYVYSGPLFSSDSRLVAFATANNFSETEITLGSGQDSSNLEVAVWTEHVNVLQISSSEARRLGGETVEGYGEWSNPRHFMLERFMENDSVLFATSSSEAGTLGIWNIMLDTNECLYFENPHLFANEQK